MINFHRFAEILEDNARLALEYEMHVDDDGYAYDDEGNREYVGKRFKGMYTPRSMRKMKDAGMSTPIDAIERRPPDVGGGMPASTPIDHNKVDALQRALAVRPNDFLSSILGQLRGGRVLTDAQKKSVRQNFYRLGIKGEADLFR